MNEEISNITDGRVSPISSSLCLNWESVLSSQKGYYLRKVRQVFSAVLSTFAPNQDDQVFDLLLRSSGYDIGKKVHDAKENVASNKISILLKAYVLRQSVRFFRMIEKPRKGDLGS